MTGRELTEARKVIRGYNVVALLDETVFDLIPSTGIRTRSDMEILKSWESFYFNQGTPYMIVRDGKQYGLWKKQEVDPR